jgi:hypothetical protein
MKCVVMKTLETKITQEFASHLWTCLHYEEFVFCYFIVASL